MDLEYVQTLFDTLKADSLVTLTITGFTALAAIFFLFNIIKKYMEGVSETDGQTWGLKPKDIFLNLGFFLLIIYSQQILGFFDSFLVDIEQNFLGAAPDLLPVQMAEDDLPVEEDLGLVAVTKKAYLTLIDFLSFGYFGAKIVAGILGTLGWFIDLFIYPLFLAERFFLLGIMQVFFPLVMALAMLEEFRDLATRFFKLYVGVYMMVPAFFMVNIFANSIYTSLDEGFLTGVFGISPFANDMLKAFIEPGIIMFIIIVKFKLYKRATTFVFQIFT